LNKLEISDVHKLAGDAADGDHGGGKTSGDTSTSWATKFQVMLFCSVLGASMVLVIASFVDDFRVVYDCGLPSAYLLEASQTLTCVTSDIDWWHEFSWSSVCFLIMSVMLFYWDLKHELGLQGRIVLLLQAVFFRFTSVYRDDQGYKFVFSPHQQTYNIVGFILLGLLLVGFVLQKVLSDRSESWATKLMVGCTAIVIGVEIVDVLSRLVNFNVTENVLIRSQYFKMNLGIVVFLAMLKLLQA